MCPPNLRSTWNTNPLITNRKKTAHPKHHPQQLNHPIKKLIQSLGKSIYADRWKIRKNMSSSLVLLTSKDHSCAGKLNKLPCFTWNIPKHTTNHNTKTLQWSPHKRIHSKQIIKKQSHIEAYSAAGKIHSCQQTTNRKEYVICLAFPYF